MKKIRYLILSVMFLMLGGCSVLEGVNNSLAYLNETTDYINELSTFAEEAPSLVQEAATNPDSLKQLENQVSSLESSAKEFNELEPPSVAEDVHNSIVEKNEKLLNEINNAKLNGEIAIEQINNSEIFTTINEIKELQTQLEELGL
jgi:vacuolar-type H+-ATPase subunit I/STV1